MKLFLCVIDIFFPVISLLYMTIVFNASLQPPVVDPLSITIHLQLGLESLLCLCVLFSSFTRTIFSCLIKITPFWLQVYMENTFNASLQTPVFGPLGITVPLQLPGTESLSCLWSQQRSAAFSEDLDMLFVENNAEILTGLVDVKVTASLKHKDYEVYRDVFIPFQGKNVLWQAQL